MTEPRRFKGTDSITCTDVVRAVGGDRLEVLNSSGQPRGHLMVTDRPNGYTLTVRGLRWYERVFVWTAKQLRQIARAVREFLRREGK